MNIRKNIDYSEMYEILDMLMALQLSQMELYCEIGKAVSQRTEKGAAVAAAEYLTKKYPNVQGFSPRNLRRMRDFYRTYEDYPALLSLTLQLGWTQNVVIIEADLPMELREWYIRATIQFEWSKTELIERISSNAHEVIVLAIEEVCCTEEQKDAVNQHKAGRYHCGGNRIRHMIRKLRCRMRPMRETKRRWLSMPCPTIARPYLDCIVNYHNGFWDSHKFIFMMRYNIVILFYIGRVQAFG